MSRALERGVEDISKRPFVVISSRQGDAEELRLLRTVPFIPVPLVCGVIHEGRSATVLPVLVAPPHRREVSIFVNIV
jgi:hypothetical protein